DLYDSRAHVRPIPANTPPAVPDGTVPTPNLQEIEALQRRMAEAAAKTKGRGSDSAPVKNSQKGPDIAPRLAAWSALRTSGTEAVKRAHNHFKREVGKLKTVIYIDDDEHKALDGLDLDSYVEKHGMLAAVTALQDYLDALGDIAQEKKDK